MKRSFIMASLMMLSVCSFAQREVGKVTIQPKLGVNVATITDSSQPTPVAGAVLGVEIERCMTKWLGISAGVHYSMQGGIDEADVSLPMFSGHMKEEVRLDYINFPILANFYIIPHLAIKAGVQPGFKVRDKYELRNGPLFQRSGKLSDLGLSVNTFDISIPMGLSFEGNNVVLEARYNWGLRHIVNGIYSRNSVFQFTIGYKFEL